MSPASHMVGRLRRLYGIVWNRMRLLNERLMHPPVGHASTTLPSIIEQLEPRLLLSGSFPVLSSWAITDDTGVDPNDKVTRDTTPTITFNFSESVFGSNDQVAVLAPGSSPVTPTAVTGWGTDTLTVALPQLSVDGTYTIRLNGSIRDLALNALNAGSGEELTFVLDASAPRLVGQPTVNAGTDAGTSRSQVQTITLEFSELLAVGLSDLQLRNRNTNVLVNISSRLIERSGNKVVVHLDQCGIDTGPQLFLANGNYDLILAGPLSDAAGNLTDYDGDGIPNEEGVLFKFHKLLGDHNGDRQAGFADFMMWLPWFGTSSQPGQSEFDLSGDGIVDAFDYISWKRIFGSSIPTMSDGVSYAYDTTPPEILITSPAGGTLVNNPSLTVHYTSDGVAKTRDFTLVQGANSLLIQDSDPAGNVGSASLTVTLDTTPPAIVVTNPKPQSVFGSPGISVDYTVDGVPQSRSVTLTGLKNTILLTGSDAAGNQGSAQLVVYYNPGIQVDPASGGVVSSPSADGSAAAVPVGATAGVANVSVTTLDAVQYAAGIPSGYQLASLAAFSSDKAFATVVTITLPLGETYSPGTEIPLGLLNQGTGQIDWTGATLTVNPDGVTASADVTHFSSYAAFKPVVTTGSAVGSAETPLPDLFTGTFSHTIPIELPQGRQEMTPKVDLIYRSSGGSSILGYGWELTIPSIQRSAKHGVPSYDDGKDIFVFSYNGQNTELAKVASPLEPWATTIGGFVGIPSSTALAFTEPDGSMTIATLDLNGDGRPDRVLRDPSVPTRWWWQRNTGSGFDPLAIWASNIAAIASGSGTTAIAYTNAEGKQLVATFDLDGDGRPDRVLHDPSDPTMWWWQRNSGSGFDALAVWASNIDGLGGAAGATGIAYTATDGCQTVATLDLNGDHRPDRVLRDPSDPTRWRWQRNTGSGFDALAIWASSIASIGGMTGSTGISYTATGGKQLVAMLDLNGDGRPDRVLHDPSDPTMWWWQRNSGSGFDALAVWASNIDGLGGAAGATGIAYTATDGCQTVATFDIDGDGRPDRVLQDRSTPTTWWVQRNTGNGFSDLMLWSDDIQKMAGVPGATAIAYTAPDGSQLVGTFDLDGDGLPDRVLRDHADRSRWMMQSGTGRAVFQAKIESSFQRFYREAGDAWQMVTKDGVKFCFGTTVTSKAPGSQGAFAWYVTKVTDPNGNYMAYEYARDGNQVYPSRVAYTGNETTGALPRFVVDFGTEVRSDVRSSYISGIGVRTARRIKDITISSDGSLVRKYVMEYTVGPSTGRSLLATVRTVGADGHTERPVIMLQYSQAQEGVGTAEVWANNIGSGPGGASQYKAIEWVREISSASAPDALTASALVDMNGDGLPDRVMSGYASNGNLNWYTQLNNGHGFEPAAIWADNIASVPGDEFQHKTVGWVRRYLGAAVPDNITATSLVDMNGDGLPDRVMSGYASDGNLNWGIQLNNGHGFEPAKIWSDSIACATGDEWQYKTIGWVRGDVTATVLIDMNGDGLPDRVMSGYASDGNMDWGIQLNNGHGFEPATIWADNIASAPGDAWQHRTIGWVNNEATATALIDMNGDGLPDRVMSGYGPYGLYQGSFAWYVQFNNGHGFEPVELWSDNIAAMPGDDKWQQKTIGWTTNDVTAVALVDINSDGLPDRVMTPYNLGSSYSWYVQLNNGHGFEPVTLWANNIASAPGDEWQHKTLGWVNRIPSATAPDDLTATALTDINGDGLTDRVMSAYSLGGPLVWGVQITRGALTEDPNTICPADTLVTIDNGLGGTTKVSYKPTTALGIDGVHCPVFLVTQIKVTDTQPSGSTPETYTQNIAYHDAYFDPADREFRGFAEVTVTDPITGNYTQTTFYQGKGTENPALKGRIKEIRAYDGTNASIFVETNAYVVSGVGPGNSSIAYPKLTQVDTTVYENGSGVSVRTRYEYDQIGNVTRETSDGDMAVTGDERTAVTVYTRAYGYGSEFNDVCRQELQDSLGAVVRRTGYIYDTRGNLKAETKWLETGEDLVTEYTYDDFGNRLAVIDALGHSTTTTYETTYNQFPATVTNGLGQVTQFVYDARFGVLTSQTDANGNTTTYSYDPLGRKLAVTDPYGRVVSSTSYPDFNTTITTDFYGLTTTQYIDGLKRAYKTVRSGEDGTAGKDVVSEKTYDNRGDLASESVPHYVDASPSTISYVRYTYDLRGRVIGRLEDYPGTADDALTQTEYLTPLSVKATDPLGHATTTVRDVYDHVVEVVDHTSAGDYHTFYQYDAADQLIRLTDDHANVTTITYDTLGRKTSLDDPDMGLTSYTYDLAGNLLTQTNAKSQVTTLTYDALNRITGRAYMDPNTTPVTYIYDQPASTNGIGKLTTVQDGAGTATYQYDTLGRATATTRTIDGIPYTTQTAYDAVGRVVQITYPDSEVVSYGYDVHSGLLESVTGASTYVAAITYDAQSRKKSVVYGNNVQMLYTYGNALRLARILSTNTSTSAVFQDLAYAYDKGGNITRVDDAVYVYTKTFQYDDLDRLIQADGIPYSPSLSWLYDSIGNMTFNSDIGSYTYGQNGAGPHAVTTAGSASYAYDANGDMVSGPGRTLFYDQENRLLYSIVGGADTAYTYDHSGQRVKQTTTGGTTIYVSNTFEVQAGASSHTTKHIFAGDQRVASITDGTASYYLSDHLGSSNLMVNAAGAVIQHVEYAPFGQTVLQTGQDITDYKFTGKELDGSGLYYYGARYYDPALCRFVTADSIVPSTNDSQQLNRYTYTLNNPVKATDPTGHYTLVDDALAAGFGALFGVVNLTIHDVAAGQWSPASAYVGAAVGGAVSGVSTLYVGPVLGAAAGGFVNSVVSQSLDDFEPGGKAGIDWAEVGGKTLEEGLTGFVFDKLPGIKGGVAAVGKRALTQLGTGTISKVSLKTAAKIVAYKATDKMCDSAWEAGKGYGERLLRDRLLRDRLLRERFLRERFQQPAPTNP